MILMLGSGTTQNFISPMVARQAQLRMTKHGGLDVRFGTCVAVSGIESVQQ